MFKAIKTKYHGPGNVKGSRISATDEDGNRIVLSWDYALDSDGNHKVAARALCDKMGWRGELASGGLKDCIVHVFVSREYGHAK